ncbi:MAG TPA: phosphoribosylformylglycinamidine synthase subunit PurQ, partial [Anaerolineaceae bacterium]|nr:phosphoribosylformylglycinamidine synthase subunit PurQ [Anaerolineaceae bacterium]
RFTLDDMALGNGFGLEIKPELLDTFIPGSIVFEVSSDLNYDPSLFEEIGRTVENGGQQALAQTRQADYASIYGDILEAKPVEIPAFETRPLEPIKLNNKKVLIPVLDGATGEYDLQRAFENAGFEVRQEIIHTDSFEAYQDSLSQLANAIQSVGVFAIPHGDYFGSVAGNVAGAMTQLLKHSAISRALQALRERQGFIFGVGAGMATLVDAGYFGDIQNDFIFSSNKNNAYTHFMQDISIIKNSYFTNADITHYTAPVSGRQMTIRCNDLEQLAKKVDIIAMNTVSHLPSDCGVDSIASKCGHVFGSRALIERMGPGLYQNLAISNLPPHFAQLAKSFS